MVRWNVLRNWSGKFKTSNGIYPKTTISFDMHGRVSESFGMRAKTNDWRKVKREQTPHSYS
jgi:hypothetical protein